MAALPAVFKECHSTLAEGLGSTAAVLRFVEFSWVYLIVATRRASGEELRIGIAPLETPVAMGASQPSRKRLRTDHLAGRNHR
jgi:hypothetical protein